MTNSVVFDHVPPPVIDRWGPGSRIPAIIIGPFAKGLRRSLNMSSKHSFVYRAEMGIKPLAERIKMQTRSNALAFK